jgi:hypothetical protein
LPEKPKDHQKGDNLLATWEKILEYASMPVHGTMSRKLRKGVKLQINEDRIYVSATLFMSKTFVRLTEEVDGENINTYFDLSKIHAIRTYSDKG